MEKEKLLKKSRRKDACSTASSTSTSASSSETYKSTRRYDLCFAFQVPSDAKTMLKRSKVEQHLLKVCNARECPQSAVDQLAVPIDHGLTSLPKYYDINHKKVRAMTKAALQTMILQMFRHLIAHRLDAEVAETHSVDGNYIYVFIHLRENGARQIAHDMKYPLQLDPEASLSMYWDNPDYVPPHVHYDLRIEDPTYGMDCVKKIGRAFQRYDLDGRKTRYDPSGRVEQSLFTDVDRARLLLLGICDMFNLEYLMDLDLLESYYMPPNRKKLRVLESTWSTWRKVFSLSPLDDVRDYFGEEIALYFGWVEEFKASLIVPVIVATSFFFMRMYWRHNDTLNRRWVNLARVGLSLTTTTWCAWFNQRWEFLQELYSLRWGSSKLDSAITRRQERQGYRADVFKKDPVNPERRIKWYSTSKWKARRVTSDTISVLCLIIAVIVVNEDIHEWLFGLFGFNDKMTVYLQAFLPSFFTAYFSPSQLIVAILAYAFDVMYNKVAYRLLDFENHKYHKTYQRSLVRKLFLFSAFDYFIPLYHLAFSKMYTSPCWDEDPDQGRCVRSLHKQIASICLVSLAGNIMELGIPYLISKWKIHQQKKKAAKVGGSLEDFEIDFCRTQYDGTMEDYQEVILMYLLLALFTTVFSLLPIMLFIFLLLEVRVDAIKLCRLTRRPFPYSCRNIGAWRGVMSTVSNITIITNICLCTFTTFGKPFPLVRKLWFTLVTTMVCFGMREFVRWHRPPLSKRVELLRQQQTVAEYVAMWGADTQAADKLDLMSANTALSSRSLQTKRTAHSKHAQIELV